MIIGSKRTAQLQEKVWEMIDTLDNPIHTLENQDLCRSLAELYMRRAEQELDNEELAIAHEVIRERFYQEHRDKFGDEPLNYLKLMETDEVLNAVVPMISGYGDASELEPFTVEQVRAFQARYPHLSDWLTEES